MRGSLISVLTVEGEIFVAYAQRVTVIQRPIIHQTEQCAGYSIATRTATATRRTGFGRIKMEFAGRLREPTSVELQRAQPAPEFHRMFSPDHAHGVVSLIHVVRKLRGSAVVQVVLIIRSDELDARKCSFGYASEAKLLRPTLAEAIG